MARLITFMRRRTARKPARKQRVETAEQDHLNDSGTKLMRRSGDLKN